MRARHAAPTAVPGLQDHQPTAGAPRKRPIASPAWPPPTTATSNRAGQSSLISAVTVNVSLLERKAHAMARG